MFKNIPIKEAAVFAIFTVAVFLTIQGFSAYSDKIAVDSSANGNISWALYAFAAFTFLTILIAVLALYINYKKDEKKKNLLILLLFLSVAGIVIADLLANIYSNTHIPNILFDSSRIAFETTEENDSWAQRGQWGDLLSGHFSILAFLGLIYSAYLQHREIKNQKKLDSFKMVLEMLRETKFKTNEVMIEKEDGENANGIEELLTYILANKKCPRKVIHSCAVDITNIESTISAIKILSKDLTTEHMEIIQQRIVMIITDFRIIILMFKLGTLYRYINAADADKQNIFKEAINYNISKIVPRIMNYLERKAKELDGKNTKEAIEYINQEERMICMRNDTQFLANYYLSVNQE